MAAEMYDPLKMNPRRTQHWMGNNKLLIAFGFLAFVFFLSTVILAVSKISLGNSCEHNDKGLEKRSSRAVVKKTVNYRLPRHVIPMNYRLMLEPSLSSNKTFNGFVTIQVKVLQPARNITLHSNKLVIVSANLKNNDNLLQNLSVTTDIISDDREELVIKTNEEIQRGVYIVEIVFSGKLEGLQGLYSSTLQNGGTMVSSKFQPTYARQAFPCFDEPDFKATYDITLVKPKNYIALSNMNEIASSPDRESGTDVVTFATSVPMSTYLACFVICDFGSKETEINANGIGNNFILRSFAQKNEMHKIDFAQDIGKRATEYYIKYYEVPFPLPKLDMIAIPDYASGATEHWGLITYRETSFLVDEATASPENKMAVANTIAHELAHMWFGNLVTLKWWDDLWLNEGFASYMQVKSLNAIEPSWTMLDQFLVKTLHTVLVRDAKLSSHPIVQTVDTPDQITAIFDSISYNKGASVLRMLEGFIGEENFRKGVSDYLKKHKFGNTVTQDLLNSLEPYFKKNNPDLNLKYILDTWTRQMGYPLLTVAKTSKDTYVVTQKRFLLDPKAVSPNDSQFNYKWFVPITYKTDKGVHDKVIWFDDKTKSVEISEPGATWLKVNNNQVGYYRVNYQQDMWLSLIEQLKTKSKQLTISDRAHLLNEVFALASAGTVPYELALNTTSYLTVEEDYVPWQTANFILSGLFEKLLNTPALDDVKAYMQELLKPMFTKVNREPKELGVMERLLRTTITSLAAKAELPEAQQKIRSMFVAWLKSHDSGKVETVETDLRSLVYINGMKLASQSEWDKLWEIYKKEEDVHEQLKLRQALAAPRDTSILRKFMSLAWDERNVRTQDYLTTVRWISNNPSGMELVWDDVRSRWSELVDRYTLNSRHLGNLIASITDSFNTESRLKEMEAFFEQYPEAGAGEMARQIAVETVRNNIAWMSNSAPAVTGWLRSHLEHSQKQKAS